MDVLTVGDFAKICQTDIKVMSGFNGKILCKRFNPEKHTEIAKREVVTVWSEIRANKAMGYNNAAFAEICVYVNGKKECDEFYGLEVK